MFSHKVQLRLNFVDDHILSSYPNLGGVDTDMPYEAFQHDKATRDTFGKSHHMITWAQQQKLLI